MKTDAGYFEDQVLNALVVSTLHILAPPDVLQLSIHRPQHICPVGFRHASGRDSTDAWLEELVPLPQLELCPGNVLLPELSTSVKVDGVAL